MNPQANRKLSLAPVSCPDLEHQRCPFEGSYTIEAPLEAGLTYNPSNIFICPRQSFLTAQCDFPTRIRVHSRCSPAKYPQIKNLYCLGSWNTNGLVRLLLADDERQRYSAWYRDQNSLQAESNLDQSQALALQSQQLPQTAFGRPSASLPVVNTAGNGAILNSLTPTIDLQIALITPLPIVAKPMQVRLTRKNQCSDLRAYANQGVFGNSMSTIGSLSSMQSYASSATASSASSAKHLPTLSFSLFFMSLSYSTCSSLLISAIISPILLFVSMQRNELVVKH